MNQKGNLWWLWLLVAVLACGFLAAACGDDDDDDNDDAADDDTADDDAADDDAADDDDDNDDATWPGAQTVTIVTPDGDQTVSLTGLPMTEYTDPDSGDTYPAVAVQDVVDLAFAAKDFDPADYKYNFIATDDYDVLSKKLDGDYRPLPSYDNLALGWFIEYDETGEKYTDIEIVWDASLGFESFLGAKMMDGGTVEMVENVLFDQDVYITVEWAEVPTKAEVNLNGLPAFDSEGELAVPLHLVIAEAALENWNPKEQSYAFNFIASDDYSLLEHVEGEGGTVLDLPYWLDYENGKDVHAGWIKNTEEDGYRIFWDEATGFPGSYSMSLMDGGTIQTFDITDLLPE